MTSRSSPDAYPTEGEGTWQHELNAHYPCPTAAEERGSVSPDSTVQLPRKITATFRNRLPKRPAPSSPSEGHQKKTRGATRGRGTRGRGGRGGPSGGAGGTSEEPYSRGLVNAVASGSKSRPEPSIDPFMLPAGGTSPVGRSVYVLSAEQARLVAVKWGLVVNKAALKGILIEPLREMIRVANLGRIFLDPDNAVNPSDPYAVFPDRPEHIYSEEEVDKLTQKLLNNAGEPDSPMDVDDDGNLVDGTAAGTMQDKRAFGLFASRDPAPVAGGQTLEDKIAVELHSQLTPSAILTQAHCLGMYDTWAREKGMPEGLIQSTIICTASMYYFLSHLVTRPKMTPQGVATKGSLSVVYLEKIYSMLVRGRREHEVHFPEQTGRAPWGGPQHEAMLKMFLKKAAYGKLLDPSVDLLALAGLTNEITEADYTAIYTANWTLRKELDSAIKFNLVWNIQNACWIRGNDAARIRFAHLQPLKVVLPGQHLVAEGCQRLINGIAILRFEGKTANTLKTQVDFLVAHRNPMMCPLAGLATSLALQFSVKGRREQFEWADWTSYESALLIYGKGKSKSEEVPSYTQISPSGMTSLLSTGFDLASVSHFSKVAHQARLAGPTMLQNLGFDDAISARMGNWKVDVLELVYQSKICVAGVVGTAGFPVGVAYDVPRLSVEVPEEVLLILFPWAEEDLANLEVVLAADPEQSRNAARTLEMLIDLRKHFWLMAGEMYIRFPPQSATPSIIFKSPHFKKIFRIPAARKFLKDYPSLLAVQVEAYDRRSAEDRKVNDPALQRSLAYLQQSLAEISLVTTGRMDSESRLALERHQEVLDALNRQSSSSNAVAKAPHAFDNDHETIIRRQRRLMTHLSVEVTPEKGKGKGREVEWTDHRNTSSTRGEELSSARSESLQPQRTPSPRPHRDASSGPGLSTLYHDNGTWRVPRTPSKFNRASASSPSSFRFPPGADDLKLPPPSAFYPYTPFPTSDDPTTYPANVLAVLEQDGHTFNDLLPLVQNPSVLWEFYKPGPIGSYTSVRELWLEWDTGAFSEGGMRPSIRLLEELWGPSEMARKKKAKIPCFGAWRDTGRVGTGKAFSRFQRVPVLIDLAIKKGQSAHQATNEYIEKYQAGGYQNMNGFNESFAVSKPKTVTPTPGPLC